MSLTAAFEESAKLLEEKKVQAKLAGAKSIDVTLPGRPVASGHIFDSKPVKKSKISLSGWGIVFPLSALKWARL